MSFGTQPEDYTIGRLPNGSGAFTLNLPTPGSQNVGVSLGNAARLKVNEWMASPSSGDDWFELYNPEPQPVSIGGWYLTDDLNLRTQYRIPPLSYIAGGINGFLQFRADNNTTKGATHTNFKLNGTVGESLAIFSPSEALIDYVTFGAQLQNVSEGRFPDGSTNITSFPGTDTPGASNLRPLPDIVINEVLTHTDPPLEDAIELYNPTMASIDISGWYLSDSKGDPFRFRIPDGTVIASGGFVVFYENQFNPDGGRPPSFALSSAHGDDVFLFTADSAGNLTGYRTSVKFGAAENPVSFGRYNTSVKTDFTAMSQRTFGVDSPSSLAEFRTGKGLSNAYPKVGPIVINEIHYHPPDVITPGATNDNTLDEFIELQNITATNVPLYHINFPTNKWRLRDAVDFTFPDAFVMSPAAFVLIVNFDPATNATQLAAFRTKFSVPAGVQILGPYGGKLDNGGESVELVKPDAPQLLGLPDAGFVPSILVDRVEYSDSGPWSSLADGIGNSLQRRAAAQYGNDPVNWFAGQPTPGSSNGLAAATLPSITSLTPNHSRAVGVSDTLTVTATGSGTLSYQWYFNAIPLEGQTNTSLVIGSVQPTNAGIYNVTVWNSAGATSGSLRLDVQVAPFITQQPQSKVAPVGGTVVFAVAVRGSTPLVYEWRKNNAPIPGATNATYRITNIQASDEATYTVFVTNAFGNTASAPAALSLNASPVIVSQPQSTNAFVGASVTFSVVANGSAPLRYQWRFGNANINNATNVSLTLNNVQQVNAGNYSVFVSNAVGSVLSQPANLTVSIPPVVTVLATDASAGEPGGDTGTFTLTRTNGVGVPLTVQFAISGTASPGADYVVISSPVTFAPGAASTNLTVTVLNDSSGEPVETVILTLLQTAQYVVGSPSNAVVNISDDDNVAPTVQVTAPGSGNLFNAGDNVALAASANDSDGSVAKVEFYYDITNKIGEDLSSPYTLTWSNAVAGNHTISAVATDNFGKTGTSAAVPITVNALPTVSITTPTTGSTFFTPADITIVASAVDGDGSVSGVDFYSGTNLIGSTATGPNYSIVWSNVAVGNYSLTARATDNRGAVGVSAVVNVAVAVPSPNFNDFFALRGVVGGVTNFVAGDNTGYTKEIGEPDHDGKITVHSAWLSWTAPGVGTCTMDTLNSTFDTVLAVYTNRPTGGQSVSNLVRVASNDDMDDFTLQSRVSFTTVPGVTYFIVVDGYGTGAGSVGKIAFHLNFATLTPLITSQPQNATINPGASATFTVGASGPAPLRYQWYFNNAVLNAATNASLTVSNASSANQGPYVVVVSNNSGSVTSSPAILTVRAAPTITGPVQQQVVDPGSNVTFTVTASGTTPMSYQWRFNGGIIQGANAATLLRNNVQHTNGGVYSVVVANSVGQASSQAELFVRPTLVSLPGLSNGVVRLTINGTPGKRYSVDGSSNFVSWTPLGNVTNSAVQSSFQDSVSAASNRTYRARLLIP